VTESLNLSTAKSIGMLGSMAIAVNSLCGPAILQLPATFQEAGIIPTTVTLILVGLLSSSCSLHMANVVSKVPGNGNFDKEVSLLCPRSTPSSFSMFLVLTPLSRTRHSPG
jgi:amino acid permease